MSAPDLEAHATALSAALAKLPPLAATVYRTGELTDEMLAEYVPERVLLEAAFTSASRHRGGRGNTCYEIASRNGRDIAPYAAQGHADEQEVVFDRGTRFLVLAHDVVDGRHLIVLADLPLAAGSAQTLADVRAARVEPPSGPGIGLPEDKQDFPIGLRPDGSPNPA